MSNDKTDEDHVYDATPVLEELRGYGTPRRTVTVSNLYETHYGNQCFYDLDAPDEHPDPARAKPYEVTHQGQTSAMSWDEAETRSIAAQTAAFVAQWDAEDKKKRSGK